MQAKHACPVSERKLKEASLSIDYWIWTSFMLLLNARTVEVSWNCKQRSYACTLKWRLFVWILQKRRRNSEVLILSEYYSMRRIGNGNEGLEGLLTLMNHPPPMTEKNSCKISYASNKGVKEVAETVMQDGCNEIRRYSHDEVVDTAVSLDGTWQKRSFTSYNGAVVAISMWRWCHLIAKHAYVSMHK